MLEAEPDHPEALHLLGLVALQSGDLGIAVERMSRSIAVGGERPDVLANLAAAYRAAGALPLVEACWRRALAVDADYAPAIRGLAAVLMDLGRFREAEDHLRRVVESDPGHAADHNALGNVARALGRDRDAAERFRRAVALEPRHTEALNNLGLAQAVLGETEDAVRRFRRVLEISPDRVEALYNLGNVLTGLHRFDEAATAFETAIRIDPDFAGAHVHLAFVRLLTGDFERGWAELEWRWRAKGFPDPLRRFRRPRWDGAPLAGRTILMVAEQGLGDTIQFARYGPLLARRGGRVVLESPPELVRLLRTLPGDVEVVARGDDPPRFDCYAALMSLPGLMGTTLETVPAEVPYLEAEPELALAWRRRLEAIVPAGTRSASASAGRGARTIPGTGNAPSASTAWSQSCGSRGSMASDCRWGRAGTRWRRHRPGWPSPTSATTSPPDPIPSSTRRRRSRPSTSSSRWIRRWPTWPARSAVLSGSCSPMRPTGDGLSGGTTVPGIRPLASSASRRPGPWTTPSTPPAERSAMSGHRVSPVAPAWTCLERQPRSSISSTSCAT